MDLRNQIRLVGNCGQPPQLRFNNDGSPVTSLRIAVDEYRADGQEAPPVWFTVEMWGRTAERACELITKGASVTVAGRLRVDEWIDRENKPRYTLVVANADFMLHKDLGDKRAGGEPPA